MCLVVNLTKTPILQNHIVITLSRTTYNIGSSFVVICSEYALSPSLHISVVCQCTRGVEVSTIVRGSLTVEKDVPKYANSCNEQDTQDNQERTLKLQNENAAKSYFSR